MHRSISGPAYALLLLPFSLINPIRILSASARTLVVLTEVLLGPAYEINRAHLHHQSGRKREGYSSTCMLLTTDEPSAGANVLSR